MQHSNNDVIETLSYKTVEKSIQWLEQKHHTTNHYISLSSTEISSTNRTFKLNQILDLSYRPFSGNTGLFYLHTIEGIFTYEVDADPEPFISAYKRLRGDFGY